MPLTSKEISALRSKAHTLKPIVTLGNAGLTDAVMQEIESSLAHHELLKIKIRCDDRADRIKMAEKICADTASTLIQSVGHVVVIYREIETH